MLHITEDVRDALAQNGPVVALESTILAHGMPYPQNAELGIALEAEVRAHGATPATIALLDGKAHIGLSETEIDYIACQGPSLAKAGATDLAACMARFVDAATTVSATAVLAARAGIRLFATGGIGGVHRGDSGDVSSDLRTLAATPIACVSAGAKAILDLPRTLEALESLGVSVIGYQTDTFPAFYSRSSGLALEHRAETALELARILQVRFVELAQGGVLIANPIPAVSAIDKADIDWVIDTALADAKREHVTGKALTPFLLTRIAAHSERAVDANWALAIHNAALAADVAREYARL